MKEISFLLRGSEESLKVDYDECRNPADAGFDALIGFPLDKVNCTGYPVMHGYFDNLKVSGYRRFCGFIQLVERMEIRFADGKEERRAELSVDVSDDSLQRGNPYFAYGYPAEIFDAPCSNLNDCDRLIWKAYTYLVDMPSRMNGQKLDFLAGYSWGYQEDSSGPLGLLPFEILQREVWEEHIPFMKKLFPDISFLQENLQKSPIKDKTVYAGRPLDNNRLPKELAVYDLLDSLAIPYTRIDHDAIYTIEGCGEVDKLLGIELCKNLFLCNTQKTKFYLLLMPGEKRFVTKEFCHQIESPRLSFAPKEFMEEYLDITPGSVSVMGLMNDKDNHVQLVIDREVLEMEYLGCHPCINTSSIRLPMRDLLEKFLPGVHHDYIVVDL